MSTTLVPPSVTQLSVRLGVSSKNFIDVPKVPVHDIDTSMAKIDRRMKYLLQNNHANNSVLFEDGKFHNHSPHSLGAAYLLGGSVQQLNKVYNDLVEREVYAKWIESTVEISSQNYRDYLGIWYEQRALTEFFAAELAKNGYDWKALVQKFLFERGLKGSPNEFPLFNSLLAGLCHPIIHLAYAYELNSKEVAIEALTLAAASYDPTMAGLLESSLPGSLPANPPTYSTTEIFEVLRRCRDDKRLDGAFKETGLQNLPVLLANPTLVRVLHEHFSAWKITDPTSQFEQSQQMAVALFLASSQSAGGEGYDFFLLHLLTASHGARVVVPYLPPQYHEPLLRQWLLTTLAMYIIQHRMPVTVEFVHDFDLDGRDWAWAVKEAMQGKHRYDVHVVKAIRAFKEAAELWEDRTEYYLKAAVRFAVEFDDWAGFGGSFTPEEAEEYKKIRRGKKTLEE